MGAASGPPGFHTTTLELQTCTFKGPSAPNTAKIPREDTQRETKRAIMVAGEEQKSAKFRPAHPPFGAQFFLGLGPTFWAHHDTDRIWPKLARPNQDGPKWMGQNGWAKIGLAKIGQIRMAKTGLAKVGPSPPPAPLLCWLPLGPPGLHTTTRELQTCTFEGPGLQKHHQNSTKGPTREGEKIENCGGRVEKSAKFWVSSGRGGADWGPAEGLGFGV